MRGLTRARGASLAGLGFLLCAALLVLAAGTCSAAEHSGRRSGYDGGSRGDGGDRGHRMAAEREGRGAGSRSYNGVRDRGFAGGVRGGYRDGVRMMPGRGGRGYADRGPRGYGGGAGGYGGVHYYDDGGGCFTPTFRYRRVHPRTLVSFGFGSGLPCYYPPAYRYDVQPYRVEVGSGERVYDEVPEPPAVESRQVTPDDEIAEPPVAGSTPVTPDDETGEPPALESGSRTLPDLSGEHRSVEPETSPSIDVENEPPAGTYYFDRFCGRQFSNLDDYTDHVAGQHHEKTVDIIEKASGNKLRTLEFVDGYWSVQSRGSSGE